MELIIKMKYFPQTDEFSYNPLIKGDSRYTRSVWSFLNRNDYMDGWLERVALPYTQDKLERAINEEVYSVSQTFPIWKAVFVETMIFDVDRMPVELDDFQKDILLHPSHNQAWALSRRLGKSFLCRSDSMAYSACEAPTYSLITLQSWDTAKDALSEVEDWIERNPLIHKYFTKGYKINRTTDKRFKNGSRISARTATKPEKMRSKNPDRVYEDEKAYYPPDTGELSTMRLGHSLRRKQKAARIVMSSPNGVDNEFEKLLENDAYHSVEIPVCKEIVYKTIDGIRRPVEFKGIVTPRLTEEVLIGQWDELSESKFLQDYMLERIDYRGQAVPEWVIQMYFDSNLETKYESKMPCIISFDLGTSEFHRSTAGVGEIRPDGGMNIIRQHQFPRHTPFWTGLVDGYEIDGVFNTVLNWCDAYNTTKIIGDATSMSSKQYMNEFTEIAMDKGLSPSDIIAYQWSRDSKQFMGKTPLYRSLVLPTIEKGRVKSVPNHLLEHEMRSWHGVKTESGNIRYGPRRKTDRDDLWTMNMQLMYAHFFEPYAGQPQTQVSTKQSIRSGTSGYEPRRSVTGVKSDYRRRYNRKRKR
jgi:hypothetical protein